MKYIGVISCAFKCQLNQKLGILFSKKLQIILYTVCTIAYTKSTNSHFFVFVALSISCGSCGQKYAIIFLKREILQCKDCLCM